MEQRRQRQDYVRRFQLRNLAAGFGSRSATCKNKGGYIDRTEWAAVRGTDANANQLFDQVNTAHNGKITLAEFTTNKTLVAGRKASFNALDKGHKGYLNSKDIVAYFTQRSAI